MFASMTSRLFDSFCTMLDTVPPKAILRAAEAEREMVEQDLARKRTPQTEETASVLNFCLFLSAAAQGAKVAFPILPVEHCAFYRKVVQKLVDAGELPYEAKERVDISFAKSLFTSLSSPF